MKVQKIIVCVGNSTQTQYIYLCSTKTHPAKPLSSGMLFQHWLVWNIKHGNGMHYYAIYIYTTVYLNVESLSIYMLLHFKNLS